MKQTKKNFLFSNFNAEISNKRILKTELKPESIYNLTTANGTIEPLLGFIDFFKDYFPLNDYQVFISKNQELIDVLIHATIYEYNNSENNVFEKRIFVIDKNYYLYELDTVSLEINSLNVSFKTFPNIINQNGKLYIFSSESNFVLIENNYSPICLTAMPELTNICNNSLNTYFTVSGEYFKVYYTEQTEIENLSDEIETYDYISLNPDGGLILKLLSYNGNIYIVQQYSISKIHTSSKAVYSQNTCAIKSKIHQDTICLIDDYIVFLSSAGLFVFDGNDIKQIFGNVTKNLCGEKFIALSHNNKYYLATNIYINETSQRVLLEFDIDKNICNIYGFGNVIDLYEIKTFNCYELAAIIIDDHKNIILKQNNKKLTSQTKYIKFNKISFDDNLSKILNHIKLSCYGIFNLKISSEIDSITFSAGDNFEAGNIGLKGHYFTIEIFSDEIFYIESIYLGINFVEE